MHLLDGIQSPKREEDTDLLACGSSTIGQYESSQCLVQIVAKQNQGLALFLGLWLDRFYSIRSNFLDFYNLYATLSTFTQELMTS